MKISQNISFSKQLIIYLILVLFVVFFLISLALVNSLEQFINNNAYSQAKAIANNALIIFEREIARIESIPQNVTDMQGEVNYKNIPPDFVNVSPKNHLQIMGRYVDVVS